MCILYIEVLVGWGGQEIWILDELLGMIVCGYEVMVVCVFGLCIYEEVIKCGVLVVMLVIGCKCFQGVCVMCCWFKVNFMDVVNIYSFIDSWLIVLVCLMLKCKFGIVCMWYIFVFVIDNVMMCWLYIKVIVYIVIIGEFLCLMFVQDNGFLLENIILVLIGIDL